VRAHIGERDLNVFEKVQYWQCLPGQPAALRDVSDEVLCAGYLSHALEVSRFFEGRTNFLLLDLNEPRAGERICRFLGLSPVALRRVDAVGAKAAASNAR
jgi:hypothetical protein